MAGSALSASPRAVQYDPAMAQGEFTHLDDAGRARMVDVSAKPVDRAGARWPRVRSAWRPATLAAIRRGELAKGDALAVARIAGIQGAKRTSDLDPAVPPAAPRRRRRARGAAGPRTASRSASRCGLRPDGRGDGGADGRDRRRARRLRHGQGRGPAAVRRARSACSRRRAGGPGPGARDRAESRRMSGVTGLTVAIVGRHGRRRPGVPAHPRGARVPRAAASWPWRRRAPPGDTVDVRRRARSPSRTSSTADFAGVDVAFFSAGGDRSLAARAARRRGRARSSSTTPRRSAWIPTCRWSCRR